MAESQLLRLYGGFVMKQLIRRWQKLPCSQCGTEVQATRSEEVRIDPEIFLCSECDISNSSHDAGYKSGYDVGYSDGCKPPDPKVRAVRLGAAQGARQSAMKAILEFELPENKQEHYNAVHAERIVDVLHTLAGELRNQVKYNPQNRSAEQIEGLEAAREILLSELDDQGLLFLLE